MAVSTETIRRITIEAQATGVTEATRQLHGLDAAQNSVATSGTTTATVTDMQTKRSLSAAEAYRRQTLAIVDGARQQDLLARGIKTATAAYNQGILGEVNSAQAKKALADRIGLLNQKYGEASQAATMLHSITERGTQVATSYAGGLGFIGTGLAGLSVGWLAAAAAAGGMLILLKEGMTAAEKFDIEMSRMGAQINATGGASGQTASSIEGLAEKISRSTNISKDAVLSASSALLVYDRVGPQVFERTMHAAAEMSAVFGTDIASNAAKLGLALDDPIAGMDRLRRSGLDLSAAQKEVISSFEKSGDMVGAQNALIDALVKRIGGTAEAQHTGLTGATHDLSVSWDEFLEHLGHTTHIGSAAAGGLDIISGALDRLDGAIDAAEKKAQRSPGLLALLGLQNGKFNPLGVIENIGAAAGYGTGDRGLFARQHGASGSWEPDHAQNRTIEDLISGVASYNTTMREGNAELHKSPRQQEIDRDLETLAKSLHLSASGLLAQGTKDPHLQSEIAETKALAAAHYDLTQAIVGGKKAAHDAAEEAARIDRINAQRVADNDKVLAEAGRKISDLIPGAQDQRDNYIHSQLGRLKHPDLADQRTGMGGWYSQYAAMRDTAGKEYDLNLFKGIQSDDPQFRAQARIVELQQQEAAIGRLVTEFPDLAGAFTAALAGVDEALRKAYIAADPLQQKMEKLVDSFGDRVGNVIDTAAFDSKNTKSAISDMLKGTAKDIFHETITRPITDSVTGGIKGMLGIGGKHDGSSELNALYVQQVGSAGSVPGLGDVGSLFSKGGFVSNLFNGGGGEGSASAGILGALSSFAGLFDEGGTIGPGQWGIKSGIPEIIQGGTHGVSVARVPTHANSNSGSSQPAISITHGGNHVTIQGNADQTTIAIMNAELDRRDRAFEGRVMAATVKAKAGFRGAWAGD